MKKLYMIIISLVLIIGLGACVPSQDNTELEERIATLETQVLDIEQLEIDLALEKTKIELLETDLELQQTKIDVLEGFYRNVVPTVGLNGQTDYYVNYDNNEYLSMMSYELITSEKDYLDKTKFPEYIWDLDGEYVDIEQLDTKLANKYFGEVYGTIFQTGSQYHFIFNFETEMTNEDFMVRVCMMIMELAEYDFYTIDSNELHIYVLLNQVPVEITIRMMLLVNDSYNLHPAIFWNELLDTRVEGIVYDALLLEDIYDAYVLNETFTGYVLPNYK
jgi:hypothetical protein